MAITTNILKKIHLSLCITLAKQNRKTMTDFFDKEKRRQLFGHFIGLLKSKKGMKEYMRKSTIRKLNFNIKQEVFTKKNKTNEKRIFKSD